MTERRRAPLTGSMWLLAAAVAVLWIMPPPREVR